MNRFLANAVGFLNALVAIIIIVVGAVAGAKYGDFYLVIGAVIGLAAAILICGLLALAVDIRNELVQIRKALTNTALGRAA
jgi:hypothetical protein